MALIEENKSAIARFRAKKDANREKEMSFVDHLEELRWHIIRVAIAWLIAAIAIFVNIDWVFDHVIYAPARSDFFTYNFLCKMSHTLHMGDALCMPPANIELQGNTVSGPFMSALNIGVMGALILTFPYMVFEIFRFIKPALSDKELKYAKGSIVWVSLCFFIGAAFGYFLLAPFTFNFLSTFKLGETTTYRYLPTLDDFIDSLTNIILGCGLAFELPIAAYVLAKIGLVNAKMLRSFRKYAIIVILFIAAVITPSPDWTSQAIVAIPLLLLYEISIWLVSKVDKGRAIEEASWQ